MIANDVLLPPNAKYYGFIDTKKPLNPHWDITWSFTFALTGHEHGFLTFLTTRNEILSASPGHYIGYNMFSNDESTSFIRDEYENFIITEYENFIITDSETNYPVFPGSGCFAIAFDSTGLFALSNLNNPGVSIENVKKNSLIIRNSRCDVIFNETLSSLNNDFFLASSTKTYQTLRFRFSPGTNKLIIDFKQSYYENYKNLLTTPIDFNMNIYKNLFIGFSFSSPISSMSTPSTLFLKNFHINGNDTPETVEIL